MGEQAGFPWHDARPLCTSCGRRGAERHYVVGYFKQCHRCRRDRRAAVRRWIARGRVRRRCIACGVAIATERRFCSAACARPHLRRVRAETKLAVITALGGRCGCGEPACWHAGPCAVTAVDALTVHHEHEDGGRVRRLRKDGTLRPISAGGWPRYRRALALPEHGMRLLCFNCHQVLTYRQRRGTG